MGGGRIWEVLCRNGAVTHISKYVGQGLHTACEDQVRSVPRALPCLKDWQVWHCQISVSVFKTNCVLVGMYFVSHKYPSKRSLLSCVTGSPEAEGSVVRRAVSSVRAHVPPFALLPLKVAKWLPELQVSLVLMRQVFRQKGERWRVRGHH